MPGASELPALSLEGVSQRFGGVQALAGVDLELGAGRVLALLGENGAGKSTAVKIMTGVQRPDAGRVRVAGTPVELESTQAAWRHGIAAVYQEPALFDELTVAENIFMGHLATRGGGFLDWAAMRTRAAALLGSLEAGLRPEAPLAGLRVAEKQLVAIARALSHEARVLILDEPTAALSRREVDELERTIRRLARQGVAILFISHRLDEVFRIADRFVVLRDGQRVAHGAMADVSEAELVQAMVGRPLAQLFPKHTVALGPPLLEVRDLAREGEFSGIAFSLRRGEVLGFYGLGGSGRTELMETLYGLRPATRGEVLLEGQPLAASPRRSIERGLVLVPEDRPRNGVFGALSVRENIVLPSLRRLASGPLLERGAEVALAAQVSERLAIKHAGLEQRVSELSGGNQQKVVLGRWLATEPKVIILDEPTQGIDVGAKAAVHACIGQLVARGVAVILVSSELPEVMAAADRVIVMRAGAMVAVFSRAELDAQAIASAALGSAPEPHPSPESVYAEPARAS